MITFEAPAARCFEAPSRLVKKPVDSSTTSAPRSFHGRLAGSRSASTRISSPFTTMPASDASTWPLKRPSTESYLRRCASVFASVRSLMATMSSFTPRASAARKKLRPIRPKPLMAIRVMAWILGAKRPGSLLLRERLEPPQPPRQRGLGQLAERGQLRQRQLPMLDPERRRRGQLGRQRAEVEEADRRQLPARRHHLAAEVPGL